MTVLFDTEAGLMNDYCRFLLDHDETADTYTLRFGSDFGNLLVAHVQTSGRPVPHEASPSVLEIHIPLNNATQSLQNKFLYLTKGDKLRLQAALRTIFDLDFKYYLIRGLEAGFTRKDIIDSFILSRGLVSNDPGDALHKRAYRGEAKSRQKYMKYLLRKSYYIFESIK